LKTIGGRKKKGDILPEGGAYNTRISLAKKVGTERNLQSRGVNSCIGGERRRQEKRRESARTMQCCEVDGNEPDENLSRGKWKKVGNEMK